MLKLLLILAFFILSPYLGFTGNQTDTDLTQKVVTFIKQESGRIITSSEITINYSIEQSDTVMALCYGEDFFVVSSYNPPFDVLAFSFENGINKDELLKQTIFFNTFFKGKNNQKASALLKNGKVDENYEPFINAMFGQTNCNNENGARINVSNIYTPSHVAVGCVAISLSTLLHHYQWPTNGLGQKTYTDSKGSITGEHSASFEDTFYNWEKIKSEYDNKVSSTEERNALGELAYHSAIALEMDFESGGSTSNINKIPDVLYNHFKHYGEYYTNNSSAFFDRLDSMIIKNSPVVFAVSGNGYAHSVICDGRKTTESDKQYYHLNMGWWGTTNGWYQIRKDFNAGGYSSIDGGVFNVVPTPGIKASKQENQIIINWETPGSISFSGYELQAKIGRKNWETIAEINNDTTYIVENDLKSTYAFRIRMKYNDFNELEAWSNMAIVNNETSDIHQYISTKINIYPNPVQDVLNIEWPEKNGKYLITIINMFGKTVKVFEINEKKYQINLDDIKSGAYILNIVGAEMQIRHKFIKH